MFGARPLPRTLEAALRDLSADSVGARVASVRDLVSHQDEAREPVVRALQKALRDEAGQVRAAAATALADVGGEEALPDLLVAVESHPAMLVYLDNVQSIGPDSIGGRRRNKGLNENLAREVMELHTLGVKGGYSQEDVTSFAKVLTGWTITPLKDADPGRFRFLPQIHQPGDKIVLGRRYPDEGKQEADAVLHDLAHHPSTARFIATKLARHFIADDPPPAAIDRLARRFQDSGGDLAAVTRALVAAPEAWPDSPTKIKTPNELVISAFRALGGYPGEPLRLVRSLGVLDQAPFSAPSPAGWPDKAANWIGPESTMKRIEWAHAVAEKLPPTDSPLVLAADVLGPTVSAETKFAVEHAASAPDGLAYVLASPEFQRR